MALLSSDDSEYLGTDAMGADAYYELTLDPDGRCLEAWLFSLLVRMCLTR